MRSDQAFHLADRQAARAPHARMLALHRQLLALRRDAIMPRLRGMQGDAGGYALPLAQVLSATWRLGDGSKLALLANLGSAPAQATPQIATLAGARIFLSEGLAEADLTAGRLPPWSVAWTLERGSPQP